MIDAIAVVAFSALMFTGSTMFFLMLMGKRLPFLPCDHKWKMVSAKEVLPSGFAAAVSGGTPATYILFECTRCPEVKTEVMPGPFAVDLNERVNGADHPCCAPSSEHVQGCEAAAGSHG